MKRINKCIIYLFGFIFPYVIKADTFSEVIGLPEKFSAVAYRYVDGNQASIKIGIMYSRPTIRLIFMVQPDFREIGITIADIPQSLIQMDLKRNAYYNRVDILSELQKEKLTYFDYILLSGNNLSLLKKEDVSNKITKYYIKNIYSKDIYVFIHNRLTSTISIYNENNQIEGEILNIMQLPQNYDVKNIPKGILQKNVPSLLNYRKE